MVAAGALFFLWLQPKKKKKAAAAAAAAAAPETGPTGRDEEEQKDKPPMEEVSAQPQELSSHYVAEVPSNHYKDGGQHELPTPVPVELPDRQY